MKTINIITFIVFLFTCTEIYSKGSTVYNKLFEIDPVVNSNLNNFLNKGTSVIIKNNYLKELLSQKNEYFELEIPVTKEKVITLELMKSEIYSPEFKLVTATGSISFDKPGLFYSGVIKNDENSLVSLSLFDNEVAAIISNKEGNYVISKLNNATDNYIIYDDKDLLIGNNFNCGVQDVEMNINQSLSDTAWYQSDDSQRPVKIYFECDYKIFQVKGSVANSLAYVSSIFNHVKIIYQNKSIPIQISQIFVWDISDPYITSTTALQMLNKFRDRNAEIFNGDLGQLLSMRNTFDYGGLGWVDVLCNRNFSFAFCGYLDAGVVPFPTWSFNVQVISHEMGHNFGSPHTHSCSWPGGPIDSCFRDNNDICSFPTRPNYNGTIMSYCNNNGAVNFQIGLGNLPGALIANKYNTAPCLVEGIGGFCLEFNGLNNYGRIPHSSSLNTISTNKKLTFEMWIKIKSYFNNQYCSILDKQDSWYLEYSKIANSLTLISVGNPEMVFPFTPNLNQWYHIAVSYDRITEQGKLYVNGNLTSQKTGQLTFTSTLTNSLYLANGISGGQEFGNCVIDEIRIWNRVRTASEVLSNYDKSISGNTNGLVAYYKLNESSGNTIYDATPNGNSGTLINNPLRLLDSPVNIINLSSEVPEDFSLTQNYPNPFNPETKIKFNTKESGIVKLTVYDILGKVVSILVNENLSPGSYETKFSATREGKNLVSGVYFYKLEINEFSEVKKMTLLK